MAEQRLIDAFAFRRELDNYFPFTKDEQRKHGIADMAKSTVLYVLAKMPTIEERKTGKWEEIAVISDAYDICGTKTWASRMRCNRCGFITTAIEGHIAQYEYCPQCGCCMM